MEVGFNGMLRYIQILSKQICLSCLVNYWITNSK